MLGEVVGQDDVAGVVGVAPLALVVVLVVRRGDVPALVEGHDVVLVARVIAARADLALTVADLDHGDARVGDGIPEREVAERAERGAGVVELADGIGTLSLVEQGIVRLHAGVVGLVVERGIVAGDDAGGVEGVDVAGAAGPRHLEAADGDDVGLAGVEGGDLVLILTPELLAGRGGEAHVIERALGVGGGGGVEVVGVVGESHELDVRARGQAPDIVQSAVERTGAVGIGGVGVQLAEVELILRLAHGEAPRLGGGLAVGAGDGDGHAHTAVVHVGGGGVGDAAAAADGGDGLTVHGHGDRGAAALVGDGGGDLRALVIARLGVRVGGQVGDDRLVEHGNLDRTGDGDALGILRGDGDGQLVAGDVGGGDGDAVRPGAERGGERLAAEGDGHVTGHAKGGVDGEGQRVVLPDVGGIDRTEVDGRGVDDAARDVDAVGHTIKIEGIDGVVGDVIHGVGLEAVGVVLKPLAVLAVILGGAALHLIAAHAAAAGADEPVGVIRCHAVLGEVLAVEGVVAGAVRAEIAVALVLEAVILAVFLHGEDHGAVGGSGPAVRDGRSRHVDRERVVLRGQHARGVLVIEHDLRAGCRQTALGGRGCELAEGHGEVLAAGAEPIGGEGGVILEILGLAAVAGVHAFQIERVAVFLSGPETVIRSGSREGQAAAGLAGGQILAAAEEGERAAVVDLHGEHGHAVALAEQVAVERRSHGLQTAAGGLTADGVAAGVVVDGDLVTVGKACDRIGLALRGGEKLEGVDIFLVGIHAVDGEAVVELYILGIAAILGVDAADEEAAVRGLQRPETVIRGGVREGQAVAGCAGGQILAALQEGVAAVGVHGDGEHGARILRDGQTVRGLGRLGCGELFAVSRAGDGGFAFGVVEHDLHAVLQLRNLRQAERVGRGIGRGRGVVLIEGEVAGIRAAVLAGDCAVLIGTEAVLAACGRAVAGERHCISVLAGEGKGAAGTCGRPGVAPGLDAVGVAALGGDGLPLAVGQGDAAVRDGDRPQQGGGYLNGVAVGGDGRGRDPAAVQDGGSIARLIHQHILAACELVSRADFSRRDRIRCKNRRGQKREHHDQRQQHGQNPAACSSFHHRTSCLISRRSGRAAGLRGGEGQKSRGCANRHHRSNYCTIAV